MGRLGTVFSLWYIFFAYFVILILAVTDTDKKIKLKFKHILILVFIFFVIAFLIILSQYLTWNAVGRNSLNGMQLRYFIPVFPLITMLFININIRLNIKITLTLIFSFITLFVLYKTLTDRYYPKYNNYEKVSEIFCNAENTDSSGKFSAKSEKSKPFLFTLRLFNVGKGGLIVVSVLRKGNYGYIVINWPNSKNIYSADSKVYKTIKSWQFLKTSFYSPPNLRNDTLSVYLWNPSGKISYFDNFKIEFYKPIK